MILPKFQYYNNNGPSVDIILHGGGKGIESQFINKLFEAAKAEGRSVIAFNFPYLARNDSSSSGKELLEEQEALQQIIDFIKPANYKKIRLVGKSLGGIVASYYLRDRANLAIYDFSVVVFGYVLKIIDLKSFPGKITIIQGSNDRFGNIKQVRKDLVDANSTDIEYFDIKGADHSYRIPNTQDPVFEDEAIKTVYNSKQ